MQRPLGIPWNSLEAIKKIRASEKLLAEALANLGLSFGFNP